MTHAPLPELDGLPDFDYQWLDRLTMLIGGFALAGGTAVFLHALFAALVPLIAVPAATTIGCIVAVVGYWAVTAPRLPGASTGHHPQ